MTKPAETPGAAPDLFNPDDIMAVLLDPLSDLASSIKYSGSKLLAMLLAHEYQRGYTAGQLATSKTGEQYDFKVDDQVVSSDVKPQASTGGSRITSAP